MVNKRKRKGAYSKFFVSLIIILNVLFTIGVLVVFYKTGNEPVVLIPSWFAFTGGELWMLTRIKIAKENNKQSKLESEE